MNFGYWSLKQLKTTRKYKLATERTRNQISLCLCVTDLYPEEVRDDIRCTWCRLTLLWDSQGAGLYLGLRKQTHLQLYCHLPSSCHLTHELGRQKREDKNESIIQYILTKTHIHVTNYSYDFMKRINKHTGTSTPLCAARSHSQQAIAVSMPCSVNIFRGDQHRWPPMNASLSESTSQQKPPSGSQQANHKYSVSIERLSNRKKSDSSCG